MVRSVFSGPVPCARDHRVALLLPGLLGYTVDEMTREVETATVKSWLK